MFVRRNATILWVLASVVLAPVLMGGSPCLFGRAEIDVRVLTCSDNLPPIPDDIQRFLLVQRAKEEANERVDGVMRGLHDALERSPIFDVVGPPVDLPGKNRIRMPHPLSANEVAGLCRQHGADAVIALEVLAGDREKKKHQGKEKLNCIVEIDYWHGSGWRMYDCRSGYVIDQFLEGRSEKVESSKLPTCEEAERELANRVDPAQFGAVYARRITPVWEKQSRDYFCSGSPEMKKAWGFVKKERWHEAEAQLQSALGSGKPKVRTHAAYNLAVLREMRGDLDGALAAAEIAGEEFDSKKAAGYRATLAERIASQQRIEQQMPARASSLAATARR